VAHLVPKDLSQQQYQQKDPNKVTKATEWVILKEKHLSIGELSFIIYLILMQQQTVVFCVENSCLKAH